MTLIGTAPKVSIMIPFYKGLDFLKLAINSVLAQSDSNWLLTVVDDCGPEGHAADAVAGFNDERITYVKNSKNLGLGGNWNQCLAHAKTSLVSLLHNDDELLPNYVAIMRALFLTYPDASIFFCQTKIINGEGQPVFSFADYIKSHFIPAGQSDIRLQGENGFTSIMRADFIFCPTMCFNLKNLKEPSFDTSLKFVADLNFIANTLITEQLIVGSREVGYAYRRHDNNTTVLMTVNNQRFQEEIWCHRKFADLAAAKHWNQGAKVASGYFVVRLNILFNIVSDLLSFKSKGLGNRLKLVLGHHSASPKS